MQSSYVGIHNKIENWGKYLYSRKLHIGYTLIVTEIFNLVFSGVTVCPRSSDPFYIVTNYNKWVTTSLTHSIILLGL